MGGVGADSRVGAEPPDMNRLIRASTGDCPLDVAARPPSVRGAASFTRCGGRPRDAPRSQGGTSPCSAGAPSKPLPDEPLPLPSPGPSPGYPGSLGEFTWAP